MNKKKYFISVDDMANIIKWYTEDLLSTREIGNRLGCSGQSVSHHLKLNGVERRERYSKTKLKKDKIIAMYASEDATLVKISRELKCDIRTIKKFLAESGISESQLLEKQSRQKSRASKGRVVTDETRQKLRAANQGKTLSEEHRRKLSQSHIGQKRSEEAIAKASAKMRGRKREFNPYKVKFEDVHKMAEMYLEDGVTCEMIGVEFGISGDTVRNHLIRYGLDIPTISRKKQSRAITKLNSASIREMIRLYSQKKMSSAELAERFNVSSSLISLYLRENNVEDNGTAKEGRVRSLTFTKSDYEERHPFFCTVEQIRDDPDGYGIEVTCKLCGSWFKPTRGQLQTRLHSLEHPDGNDGGYFYCSDKCKGQCPVYNLNTSGRDDNFTNGDLKIWSEFVIARDKECLYCGSIEKLHAHHINPKSTHPKEALDPDNGIAVCKDCHRKLHTGECSTAYLAAVAC